MVFKSYQVYLPKFLFDLKLNTLPNQVNRFNRALCFSFIII